MTNKLAELENWKIVQKYIMGFINHDIFNKLTSLGGNIQLALNDSETLQQKGAEFLEKNYERIINDITGLLTGAEATGYRTRFVTSIVTGLTHN